jgi:hypothetical protein
MQAYRNECTVWRTRAAELDLAFKHYQNELIDTGVIDAQLVRTLAQNARRSAGITWTIGGSSSAATTRRSSTSRPGDQLQLRDDDQLMVSSQIISMTAFHRIVIII